MSLILKTFLENEAAIRRLLRRFFPRAQDVDELAQETFLRAFTAEGAYTISQPKSFLFRVAKNVALDECAKSSRKSTDFMEDFVDPDVLGSADQVPADDVVASRQVLRLLAKAVETLPPQCKQVFVMHRIYGVSHKEIASALGIATSTVEKHVATGLVKCSDYLRRQGCEVEQGRLRVRTAARKSAPEPREKSGEK